jgi:hypothetical protein
MLFNTSYSCLFVRLPSDQLIAPPVFGELNPKFTDFIAPGMIIAIAFAQSIGLTAMAIVMARLEGTLDRQVMLAEEGNIV